MADNRRLGQSPQLVYPRGIGRRGIGATEKKPPIKPQHQSLAQKKQRALLDVKKAREDYKKNPSTYRKNRVEKTELLAKKYIKLVQNTNHSRSNQLPLKQLEKALPLAPKAKPTPRATQTSILQVKHDLFKRLSYNAQQTIKNKANNIAEKYSQSVLSKELSKFNKSNPDLNEIENLKKLYTLKHAIDIRKANDFAAFKTSFPETPKTAPSRKQ